MGDMYSFNLSILECKGAACISASRSANVLIYPYWNVKFVVSIIRRKRRKVLIYPYWNVKFNICCIMSSSTCFNLSILECKAIVAQEYGDSEYCFNLSILECKAEANLLNGTAGKVLIYPYWNVKQSVNILCTLRSSFNLSILECKVVSRERRTHKEEAF